MIASENKNINGVFIEIASLGLLAYEKSIIEDYIAQYHSFGSEQNVKWLHARTDNLKVIIIRASFLGTSEVTKYLNDLPNDVLVLSICNKKDDLDYAISLNINIINISENDPQKIQAWVNTIPVNKAVPSLSTNHLIIDQSNKFNTLNSAESVRDLFALFSDLKSILYLRTNKAELVWIDIIESKVYLNTEKILIPSIESYEWQISPPDFEIGKQINIDNLYKVSLNEWIWEVIWESNLDFTQLISVNSAYKLAHWPHFCQHSKIGRAESLRLSALIKKTPLSYRKLLARSVYDKFIVSKFIYSMLIINFIKLSSVNDEKISLNSTKITALEGDVFDVFNESKDQSIKRNFLNKMRKIIGL
ncbi:hypothetical protein AwWohl_00330 [Gammaproteobacteria bacterium]|nr:hypothetical protein AwWohl_00330 [Gammaproteobacteria bacterium]